MPDKVVIQLGAPYYIDLETGEEVESDAEGAMYVAPEVEIREEPFTADEKAQRQKDIDAANKARLEAERLQTERRARRQELEALIRKQQPGPDDAMKAIGLMRALERSADEA